MKENIKSKALSYFGLKEFQSFILELTKKYEQYGNCVGVISLIPKTEAEALKLSTFLAKNIKVKTRVKIKIKEIQKSLDDSIYEGMSVNDLVFLMNPLIKTNKERKEEQNNLMGKTLKDYQMQYKDSNIKDLFCNEEILKRIKYYILHDISLLNNVLKALNSLPFYEDDINHLAIFSSNVTGNPHYFDLDTHASNVFIQFISFFF